MWGRIRRAGALLCCALVLTLVAFPSCAAFAEESPVDAATLTDAAKSAAGQLQGVKLGAQGATVTVGGKEMGIDLGGLLGGSGGSGGAGGTSNYMGMGMLVFGASVLTRLLATISRIMRPSRPRERWIET